MIGITLSMAVAAVGSWGTGIGGTLRHHPLLWRPDNFCEGRACRRRFRTGCRAVWLLTSRRSPVPAKPERLPLPLVAKA